MNKQLIKQMLEEIKAECVNATKDDDKYREMAIFVKDIEDSVNIVIDKDFEFEYHEDAVLLKYMSEVEETKERFYYRHLFNISDIYYITDEV